MHPVLKFFLIGCAVVIVLGIIAVAVVGWYVKSHSGQWMAQGKAVRGEGMSFGRTATEPQCVSEAMTRYRAHTGMVNGISQRLWLDGCLETASVDAEFCAGVPAEDQFTASVTWRVKQCRDFGFQGDSTCPNIVAEVQRYCAGPVRRKKTSQ